MDVKETIECKILIGKSEDLLLQRRKRSFLRAAGYLLLTFSIILIITSCSGIRRYTMYSPNKENSNWNNQVIIYPIFNLSYDTDIKQSINYFVAEKDTLFLQTIPGNDGLFFGPMLIPAIPVFLFPWGQDNWSKLTIILSSHAIEEYVIDCDKIHFTINNKKAIYPIRISQENGENRFYFEEKVKKIKGLAIYVNSIKINDVIYPIPPLFLKRKYKLDYRPLIFNN